MADNTTLNTMTGGDTISSDDLTTLNGAASGTQKVQRMKVGYGVDGTLQDVTAQNPLPVDISDTNDNVNINSIAGNEIKTVAPGVQAFSDSDELGDPLTSTAGARDVFVKNQNVQITPARGTPDTIVNGQIVAVGGTVQVFLGYGQSTVIFQVSGTWSAQLVISGLQIDGTWSGGLTYNQSANSSSPGGTITTGGTFVIYDALKYSAIKIYAQSVFTSGIVQVSIKATTAPFNINNFAQNGTDGVLIGNSHAFPAAGALTYIMDSSNGWNRTRSVVLNTNTTGVGIQAAGLLAQLDDTSPTAITENQFGNLRIAADRSLLVSGRSVTPTQTSVAGSASSVSILAANASRKGATIANDSTAILYLKLGTTASTTSYSAKMQPDDYYELPYGYIGAVDGIWSAAAGNARITELV